MSYSINDLAKLAGISTRTLRYYDKCGLLKARRDPENNYRYYEETEVDQLQKIMFLKLFDLPLAQIKQVMVSSQKQQIVTLQSQRQKLVNEQKRLSDLIISLDKTLAVMKGKTQMNDVEKFTALKAQAIVDNEKKYGKEIRSNYGDETIDASKEKFCSFSEKDFNHVEDIKKQILIELRPLVGNLDVTKAAAQHLFNLHQKYLLAMWPTGQYSSKAHKGLANMYVGDARFRRYYEEGTGKKDAAKTLKAIIDYYA
ncbi:MerR family transcriptional regulator [Lactobacillus sp. B4026]|uniref:MerR family transcriptional regulator n=1 Tax=Lactobacillus sp. B4026 TaxID=2818035 RepID=UPI00226B1E0F|nr:MerR family transcriptional regulator [Lactobacillus sp. B4026]MCX8736992.1 MerR family transcriptional regulator [Lactobacillus sp. B4026]